MALTFNAIQRGAAFERAQAFPLDKWSYFESYNLAVAAAATAAVAGTNDVSNTVYFVGQTLVVNEGTKATLYIIQPDKTLKEVGAVPVGDGKSIEVVNGQIKLKGFGGGYYQYNTNYVPGSTEEGKKDQYIFVEEGFKAGLQPQVVAKASGEGFEIAWYEPNPTTVEGLQAQITALDGSVNNLTSKVDTKADASSLALYQTKAISSIADLEASTVQEALEELVVDVVSNTSWIASHTTSFNTLANNVTSIDKRVSAIEDAYASTSYVDKAINDLSGVYASVAEVSDVTSRVSAVENAVSNLTGAFQFQGVASSVDALPTATTELKGHVYIVGELEYVCDGTSWILLGDEGSYVLKTTYNEHLIAQANVDAGQNTKISQLESATSSISSDLSDLNNTVVSVSASVDYLLANAVQSVSDTENLSLSIDGNILTASVIVSKLELAPQGNLQSWVDSVDSTLSNHASRLVALEGKPFDTYASTSYVDDEISKLDAAIKAEAEARAQADTSLGNRLELVEDSLGLGGEGNHGGVAEQIATIIGEVWGANASAENLAEASSRIDDHEGRIGAIEDKVTNTLATKEYVKEQIQSAEHVISVKTDDTDFFEITKDQDDVVTINVKDDIENIIAGAITSISVVDSYLFNMSISGHTLIIDHTPLLMRIGDIEDDLADATASIDSIDDRVVTLESNAVLNVSGGDFVYAEIASNQLTLSIQTENLVSELTTQYASTLASGIASQLPSNEIIKHVFGVESIASNAVALVSSAEIVSALDDLGHNHDAIKSTVQKAVTSVQTSTLVVSHVGNNLTINLPSEIWLDGGNAAGAYEAEEAVYNELLNNEYGN